MEAIVQRQQASANEQGARLETSKRGMAMHHHLKPTKFCRLDDMLARERQEFRGQEFASWFWK